MRPARPAFLAAALVLIAGPPAARAADLTIDDRALAHAGKWSEVTAKQAKGRTLLKATRKGATLTARTKARSGGAVVVQVGKGRGTVALWVDGKRKRSIATGATRTAFKTYTFGGAGTVKLTVTKAGKGVYVDAIVLKGLGNASSGGGAGTGTGAGGATKPGGAGGTPIDPGAIVVPPAPAALGPLTQVDTSASGIGGDGDDVTAVAVSPDGRQVAFWSRATNLVPGVANGALHLYVKTLGTGAIRVLDAAQDGTLSNDGSTYSEARAIAWKPDSNEVLFTSNATNLGPDVSGLSAPYLYAKQLDDSSVGILAEKATIDAAWSPDGTKIVYGSTGDYCFPAQSPCTGTPITDSKLYVLDLANGFKHIPVSATQSGVQPVPNGGPNDSFQPVWSPDSTKVAFASTAAQLIPGDTNTATDILVKDLTTLSLTRVSTTASGGQANATSEWPAWSPDGTRIAFDSKADNLLAGDNNSGEDVFVKTLAGGAVIAASAKPSGAFTLFSHRVPKWSPDGTRIAFNSRSVDLIDNYLDANQRVDVYVRNLVTGAFQVISVRPDGVIGNADSTQWNVFGSTGGWLPDGHGLVFLSRSTNFSADTNAFSQSLFLKTGL